MQQDSTFIDKKNRIKSKFVVTIKKKRVKTKSTIKQRRED